jgi:hypothetical protein
MFGLAALIIRHSPSENDIAQSSPRGASPSIIDGVAFRTSCRCLHKSNLAVVRDRRAGIIGEERRAT